MSVPSYKYYSEFPLFLNRYDFYPSFRKVRLPWLTLSGVTPFLKPYKVLDFLPTSLKFLSPYLSRPSPVVPYLGHPRTTRSNPRL